MSGNRGRTPSVQSYKTIKTTHPAGDACVELDAPYGRQKVIKFTLCDFASL
jgi:hypothetical protein